MEREKREFDYLNYSLLKIKENLSKNADSYILRECKKVVQRKVDELYKKLLGDKAL